jgi:hypothetical protein
MCRKQAEVIQTHDNGNVRNVAKTKPSIVNTKGSNLVAVRHTIVQVSKLPLVYKVGIICCSVLGLTGLACTYTFVHNISSSRHPHIGMNIHMAQTRTDPCRWQPRPPVRVDASRKTIPKFPSKLKYGHVSQLAARGQDGLTD